MPVPFAVYAFICFQKPIQVKSSVCWNMHFSFNKFFWRQVKCVHQFGQHSKFLTFQTDKFTAFQAIIFFLFPVASEDIQKFFLINILCGNVQIKKISGYRNTYGYFYFANHMSSPEPFCTLNFSKFQKFINSRFHQPINLVLIFFTGEGICFVSIFAKPCQCLVQDSFFHLHIPKFFFI